MNLLRRLLRLLFRRRPNRDMFGDPDCPVCQRGAECEEHEMYYLD